MSNKYLLPGAAAAAVLLLVAGIWALTGSADGPTAQDPPVGGQPSPSDTATLVPPDAGEDGAQDRTPGLGGGRLGSGPVTIDGFFEREPATLVVTYSHGAPACYGEVGEPEVEELGDRVIVSLTSGAPTGPADQMCDMMVREGSAAVALRAPLGGRTVIDGATGQPLEAVAN